MFSVLVFILVLSLLIFVHELGHFIAAKLCGIYVDRFSIGMPPRLFGIKIGETDYCIGALPIGGFVKMAGQEDAPLTEEEREEQYGDVPPERWFNNKPIWQRLFVLLAGPAMNFVLAIVLYTIMVGIGGQIPESELSTKIGMVEPESAAAEAPLYREEPGKAPSDYTGAPDTVGWQTGDVVLELDGKKLDKFLDLAFGAVLGGKDKQHYALLERTLADDTMVRYVSPITPKLMEGESHPRFGVAPFETALIGDVIDERPAQKAGLEKDDIILRVDGEWIDQASFVEKTEKTPEGTTMTLDILREGKRLQKSLQPQTIGRFKGLVYGAEKNTPKDKIDQQQPIIYYVSSDFKENSAIQRKDVIAKINGEDATIGKMRNWEIEHPGESLSVTVQRPSILFGLIQKPQELTVTLPVEPVRAVGVSLAQKTIFYRPPVQQWFPEGLRRSYSDLALTMSTLKAVVSRNVSGKELGGPVMIFQVVSQAAQSGLFWLLKFTAFISVNLCVFNLVPLPVLDGGQVVVNALEAVRRKPLSMKFQERFQFVGLMLIVALMLFVTWNDISRFLTGLKP